MTNATAKAFEDFQIGNLYHHETKCPICGRDLLSFKDNDGLPRTDIGACPDCGWTPDETKPQDKLKELTNKSVSSDANTYIFKTSILSNLTIFNHRFQNFIANTKDRQQLLKNAQLISEKIARGQIVHSSLIGPTGTGKTHIAFSIAYDALKQSDYRKKVCFIDLREYITQRKKAISSDKTVASELNRKVDRIKKADIVVIDDLGAENSKGTSNSDATQYTTELVSELVNAREDKTLIVTSNLNYTELGKMYGDRIVSRIRNHSNGNNISFMNLPDYRYV